MYQTTVVALLVKKGMCSYAQKAEFASLNIHPAGVVKILIIDGEMGINNGDDNSFKTGSGLNRHGDHLSDVKSLRSTTTSFEIPFYHNTTIIGDNGITLSKKHEDDISVAILHVSYGTGNELLDVLLGEDPIVRNEGGTLVAVDGMGPPLGNTVTMIETVVSILSAILVFLCMASFLEGWMEDEPEPDQPRRHRRQRLTFDQVRKMLPIGIFDGTRLVYDEEETVSKIESSEEDFSEQPRTLYPQPAAHSLDDACTICLDDYEVGDKLRCLPCGHVFHAGCIGKWLVERSATCPLCNEKFYPEEGDDDESEDSFDAVEEHAATAAMTATEDNTDAESPMEYWWRTVFRGSQQQRARTDAADGASEALTEPLLQQHERSDDAPDDDAIPEVNNV